MLLGSTPGTKKQTKKQLFGKQFDNLYFVSALGSGVTLQRTYSCKLEALVIEAPCVPCSYSQKFILRALSYLAQDEPDVSVALKKGKQSKFCLLV